MFFITSHNNPPKYHAPFAIGDTIFKLKAVYQTILKLSIKGCVFFNIYETPANDIPGWWALYKPYKVTLGANCKRI